MHPYTGSDDEYLSVDEQDGFSDGQAAQQPSTQGSPVLAAPASPLREVALDRSPGQKTKQGSKQERPNDSAMALGELKHALPPVRQGARRSLSFARSNDRETAEGLPGRTGSGLDAPQGVLRPVPGVFLHNVPHRPLHVPITHV